MTADIDLHSFNLGSSKSSVISSINYCKTTFSYSKLKNKLMCCSVEISFKHLPTDSKIILSLISFTFSNGNLDFNDAKDNIPFKVS